MGRLTIGEKAPSFSLLDQHEKTVSLSGFRGKQVVLYFYPKADTPGCTKQSCNLRDIADDIGDAVIIGISPDVPEKLARFDNKYELGFHLLSDSDHRVADAYGVWAQKINFGKKYFGIVRSAFVIDTDGTLLACWYKISPDDTPKNVLAVVQRQRLSNPKKNESDI